MLWIGRPIPQTRRGGGRRPGEVLYFLGSPCRSWLRLQSSWGQKVIDQSHATRLIFSRWSVWCLISCRYVLEHLFSDLSGYRENFKNGDRRDTGTSVSFGFGNVAQRSVGTGWQLAYWSLPPDSGLEQPQVGQVICLRALMHRLQE